jgi:tRNA(Ile)-lysidine synthase
VLSCPEPSPLADVGSRATLFQPFLSVPALLLALSGGPDSMALLHLARRWASDLPQPPRLEAATVDHALRPGSRTEAETVGRWCADLDIRHHLLVWQGDKPRSVPARLATICLPPAPPGSARRSC